MPFHTAFEPRGHLGGDLRGQRERLVVGSGNGDYVPWMEKDPECVAADTVDFGVPFFVWAGDVTL